MIPTVTEDTIVSVMHDLTKGGLTADAILTELVKTNPVLSKAILDLGNNNTADSASKMLFMIEIIQRQMESDQLNQNFGDRHDR